MLLRSNSGPIIILRPGDEVDSQMICTWDDLSTTPYWTPRLIIRRTSIDHHTFCQGGILHITFSPCQVSESKFQSSI